MNFARLAVFCALTLRSCALAHVPLDPPIEPCPEDSVAFEGACKCDHSLCDKPPCASDLSLVTNSTDIPGSCCPTYSCEGCAEEERVDGECPCLPGATLRAGRRCECVDPHKTFVNDTCVCDQNKCELPDLCDERSVPVKDIVGCCEKVRCVPCPVDSYPTDYNDLLVEDKCICYPCPPTKCSETQRPEILRRGKSVPGMCCDIYNCENVDPNKGCTVNGTTYSEGETWNSGDEKCKCQNGISFCSPVSESESFRSCLSGGKVFKHLDSWVEDACTNCTCKNGDAKCIAHMCDVYTSEVKKPLGCPSLAPCKKVCENGFKLNKQGCEICKCKPSDKAVPVKDKYAQLDGLLKEYNLTETDVIDLVKKFARDAEATEDSAERASSTTTSTTPTTTSTTVGTTTTSTSTSAPSTTVFITDSKKSHGDCSYSCNLEYALYGFLVGVVVLGTGVLCFWKCSERNRQKYKMDYNYKPVGKEAVDKNLNFSPIIKSKNFELQSYNEKKNVI